MMKDKGFPWEPNASSTTQGAVFSFPVKAPEGSILTKDRTSLEQLEHWLVYQRHWCEHKPSVTINVKETEWMEVGAWVFRNFDELSGVSFLPYEDHAYPQAPYQEITEEEYDVLLSQMPKDIDWGDLSEYETRDNTISSQTLACSGSTCEVVDL